MLKKDLAQIKKSSTSLAKKASCEVSKEVKAAKKDINKIVKTTSTAKKAPAKKATSKKATPKKKAAPKAKKKVTKKKKR